MRECSPPEGPHGSALGARTEGPGAGEPMFGPMRECSPPEGPHGSAVGARTEGPGAGEPMFGPMREHERA